MTSVNVALFCFLILSGRLMIQNDAATLEFTWLSGAWMGDCRPEADCGSSDGHQTRTIACVDRNQRTVEDAKCDEAGGGGGARGGGAALGGGGGQGGGGGGWRPQDRRTCFRVCEQHRHRYHWSVGAWGPCHPRRGTSYCQDSFGVQYRNVTCLPRCPPSSFVSASVSEACEAFDRAPPSARACRLPCIEHCITTDFGPWSSLCPHSCQLTNRTRHRIVLSVPGNGGEPCADLVETQSCPSGGECGGRIAPPVDVVRYRLGKWTTDCLPLKDGEMRRLQKHISVLGYRWRTVECVDQHGNVVDIIDDRCLRISKKPVTTQLCLLDGPSTVCSSDDHLVDSRPTEWTNFNRSLYFYLTNGDRSSIEADTFLLLHPTHRRISDPSAARDCHGSTLSIPASAADSSDYRCKSFKWITGGWTECLTQFKCGQGVQNRTVLCVRTTDSVPVADDRCLADPPIYTRRCFIPCPLDCVVSSWSTWSDCLPEKCRLERVKQKDGYRLRLRGIIQEGVHGGKECPHLHALQPCEFPACYAWKIVTSGQCIVRQTGMVCGEGVRNRTAECINLQGEKVSGRFCPDPRPSPLEGCVVPCHNDCLLSEWNDWSPCSQTCSLARSGGYKTRFRDILATSGPGGADCPPLRHVIEKERCGDLPCLTYHWQTKDWGVCRMHSATKCGNGLQYREVYCVESSGEKVASKRCLSEYVPAASRNCSILCPVDCVVSVFTDWSPCPVTCLTDKMNVFPEQFRHRFVLEYPAASASTVSGGLQCPHLTESQPCTSLPRCTSFEWHLSEWSTCIHANPSDRCAHGFRTRVVRCLDSNDDQATDNRCLSGGGVRPVVAQPCHVTCGQEPCAFSDWSTWSPCSKRCHGKRRRSRTMEGLSGRIPECFQRGTYPIEETESCNDCPEYVTKLIGLWSDCILDALDSSVALSPESPIGQMRSTSAYCGIGRRHHSLVCTDTHGNNVSALTCNAFDSMEEMCFIPCRRDCQLSAWTSWSSCETGQRCGNGERRRSRYLIDTSLDGGRDCPPLVDEEEYQTLPCHVSCEEFRWLTGDWSICTTLSGLSSGQCGAGIQSRGLKCVRLSDDGEATEISERLCDKKTKPRDMTDCQIPCPGQCVLSAWSEWTKCPEKCQSHTRRHRSRVIIRPPDPKSSNVVVQCPPLDEIERCDLEPRCQTYTVLWSSWGPCIPHQNLTCGSGLRQRFSECLRSDGSVVSKDFCQQHPSDLEMTGVEPCSSPCPVDCVVSEWSPWSSCSETCRLGLQTRARTVLVEAENRGRHCPEPIIQRRYCPYQECFHWELTDWGRCEIEDDSCGYGLHHRKLKCARLDDVEVDLELCDPRLLTMFKLTGECFVSCPGDCEVSAWSSWSPCHRPCTDDQDLNKDKVGSQTRSRVVLVAPDPGRHRCPSSLLETRSCSTGHCPRYRWHAGIWIGNRRQVWCQDVSGGKVFGACRESEMPTAVKSCHPPCIVPHSECRDFDLCICSRGYEPVYRGGLLLSCQPSSTSSSSSSSSSSSDPERIQTGSQETSNNLALYHPYDMSADVWMYSIMASGAVFVILLIIAIYVICWRSRQQRSAAQPLTTDAELKQSDGRNGKPAAVSQAYKEGLNASFAADKQPSPKEYFEQTDLSSNYNFLQNSLPEHHQKQQQKQKSSSFITNYTKCSSKNDFYPLS